MHDLSLQIVLLCFQCCIDLKYNVLRIGTTGNDAAFLSEADLKDKEQLEKEQAVSKKNYSKPFVSKGTVVNQIQRMIQFNVRKLSFYEFS